MPHLGNQEDNQHWCWERLTCFDVTSQGRDQNCQGVHHLTDLHTQNVPVYCGCRDGSLWEFSIALNHPKAVGMGLVLHIPSFLFHALDCWRESSVISCTKERNIYFYRKKALQRFLQGITNFHAQWVHICHYNINFLMIAKKKNRPPTIWNRKQEHLENWARDGKRNSIMPKNSFLWKYTHTAQGKRAKAARTKWIKNIFVKNTSKAVSNKFVLLKNYLNADHCCLPEHNWKVPTQTLLW